MGKISQTVKRLTAVLLIVLMGASDTSILTLAESLPRADQADAVLASGAATNAILKQLAGDTVADAGTAPGVQDTRIVKILRSSSAPAPDADAVNLEVTGSPAIYAWFAPLDILPKTGAEDSTDILTSESASNDLIPAATDSTSSTASTDTVTPDDTVSVSAQNASSDAGTTEEADSTEPGVIYLYTAQPTMAYGADVMSMFEGMASLTDISGLRDIAFDQTQDASRMFYGDSSLKDVTPLAAYDGSALVKADKTFEGTQVKAEDVPQWYIKANTVAADDADTTTQSAVSEAASSSASESTSAQSETASVTESAPAQSTTADALDAATSAAEAAESAESVPEAAASEVTSSAEDAESTSGSDADSNWQAKMTLSGLSAKDADITGVDLSSKRLLVGCADDMILDPEHEVSSLNGLHLMQYDTEEDAKIAYAYYKGLEQQKKIDFADIDIAVQAASDTSADASSAAANSDPLTSLKTAQTTDVKGTVIALIDTGVDADASGIVGSVSMLGGSPVDEDGHGTNMLNAIRTQDPDARVLSIKALDQNGTGTLTSVYAAMRYAIDQGVSVINLSLSGYLTEENAAIDDLIQEATKKGIYVVGAAGNDGRNAVYYMPGSSKDALVVGSADEKGLRRSTSNFGSTVDYNVTAPSTSYAAAYLSGYIAKNLPNGQVDFHANENGLVWTTDYIPASVGEETADDIRRLPTDADKYILVKYTLADASEVSDGTTIDDVISGRAKDAYLGTIGAYATAHKNAQGQYLFLADSLLQNGLQEGKALDAVFVHANDDGEIVRDGVSFNRTTMIGRVDASALTSDVFGDIQIQVLVPVKAGAQADVNVSVEDQNGQTLSAARIEMNPYDTIGFDLPDEDTALTKDQISVFVNKEPDALDSAAYDLTDGELTVYREAAGVSDLVIRILSGDAAFLEANGVNNMTYHGKTPTAYLKPSSNLYDLLNVNDQIVVRGREAKHSMISYADGAAKRDADPLKTDGMTYDGDTGSLMHGYLNGRNKTMGRVSLPTSITVKKQTVDFTFYAKNNQTSRLKSNSGDDYNRQMQVWCTHAGRQRESEAAYQNFTLKLLEKHTKNGINYMTFSMLQQNAFGSRYQEQGCIFQLAYKAAVPTKTPTQAPEPAYGDFRIKKESSAPDITNGDNHFSLQGAVFQILNSSGKKVAQLTTGADGYTNTIQLQKGHYTIKETQAPAGYNASPNVTFDFAGKGAELIQTIMDTPKYKKGNVTVTKKASAWSTNLKGAEFGLYEWSNRTKSYSVNRTSALHRQSDGCTWKSDWLYSTDDNAGKFQIKETKMPGSASGAAFVKEFVLSNGSQPQEMTYTANNDTKNVLQLKKLADGADDTLGDAVFKLQQWSQASQSYKDYKTIDSQSYNAQSGLYTCEVINTQDNQGRYYLEEVTPPSGGYSGHFTAHITIRSTDPVTLPVMTVTNTPLYPNGRLVLTKTDALTGQSITDEQAASTVFAVYEWYDGQHGRASGWQRAGAMQWDAKAKQFVAENLVIRITKNHRTHSAKENWNEGRFKIVEEKAPTGFVNQHFEKEFTFTESDVTKTQTLTAAVSNTPNEHHLYKRGTQNPEAKPDASFSLKVENGRTRQVVINGKVTPVSTTGTTVATVNGEIDLSYIPAGTYTYRELSVEKPYVLNQKNALIRTFTVNADGTITDDDEKNVASASTTVRNAEGVNLTIVKTSAKAESDADDAAAVSSDSFPKGTTFSIEEYSKATGKYTSYATGVCLDASTGVFTDPKGGTIGLVYTDDNQGKYRITETKAADGYLLDTAHAFREITLPNPITKDTQPVTVTFANQPNLLLIHKQDTNGNEVEGCTFKVWNTDDSSRYLQTQSTKLRMYQGAKQATAAFYALPAGSYAYQEIAAPNGYKADQTVHSFRVLANGQILNADGKTVKTLSVLAVNPITRRIRVEKADTDGLKYDYLSGFPNGTVFAVYEWSEETKRYSTVPSRYITYITDSSEAAGKKVTVSGETKKRAGDNGTLPKTGIRRMLPKTGVKDSAKYNFTYGWNDGTYMYLNVRNKSTGAVVKNVSIYVGAHIDANHKFSTGAWTHDDITWYYRIANSKINVRKVSGVNLYSDTVHTDASTRVPNRWEANSGFGCFASYKVYFEDESGKRIKTVTKNLGDYIVTGAPSLTKTGYALTWKKLSTDGTYSAVQATPPGTTPEERSSRGTSTNYLAAHDEGTNKASEEQRNPYLHVKAFWTANTYKIHFNANNGTGSMDDQSMTYDKAADLTANAFTRNGYTFNGWNTQANGKGTSYANKASVRNLTSTANGTVNLYAQWNLIKYTVTVKYDANGGTGSADQQTFTSYGTDDGNKSIGAFHTGTISRPGYTLAGWQVDGTGDTYTPDNAVKASWVHGHNGQTVTLKAQWTPKTYTIVYDGNGADGGRMDNQTVQYDDTLTLKSGYTRTGYTFVNWKDGYGDYRSAGTSVTVKELADKWMIPNHTDTFSFWAQWKPNEYKLTFNLNGGKASGTMPPSYTYGMPVNVPQATKAGCLFAGWQETSTDEPVADLVVGTTGMLGDKTYTAAWIETGSFVDPDTNQDPELVITADNKGKFRIKEVQASEGYILDTNYKDIDLNKGTYTTNGGTTESKMDAVTESGTTIHKVPFTNTPNEYVIKKIDARTKKPLEGAEFTIIDPTGASFKRTSDANGLITLKRLKAGKWTYKETKAPDGYALMQTTFSFTVADPTHLVNGATKQTVAILNRPVHDNGFITVKKTTQNGQTLSNVKFTITQPDGTQVNIYTDESGNATYPVMNGQTLADGTYKLQEAPIQDRRSGLKVDSTIYTFTVVKGQVSGTYDFQAFNDTNHFNLKKTDEAGHALTGASFRIWNDNTAADTKFDQTLTTDETGTISLSDLAAGSWHYQETAAPDGYEVESTVYDFTVAADGAIDNSWSKTAAVKDKKTAFQIHKTDESGKALAGVSFHVWNSIPDGSAGHYDNTLTTDANGAISITGLKAGTYSVQETAAPDGYLVDPTISTVKLEAGKSVSVSRQDKQNHVTLKKVDENGNAITAAAVFGFTYTAPAGTAKTSVVTTGTKDIRTVNGKRLSCYTTSNGQITFTGLAAGTYTYQEVTAPDGYVTDSTVHAFTVNADGTLASSETGVTLTDSDATMTITAENKQQTRFTPKVKKVDAENGENLENAAFELQVADGSGSWKAMSPANTSTYDKATQTYVFREVVSNDETTQYRIVETKAPAGYVRNFTQTFTAAEAKKQKTPYTFDAPNTPNQVILRKVDADGRIIRSFEGFNVSKQGDPSWKYAGQRFVTAGKGEVVLKRLPAGVYTYSEDPDHVPAGYLADTDENGNPVIHTFTVTADGKVQGPDGKYSTSAQFDVEGAGSIFDVTDPDAKKWNFTLKKTDAAGAIMPDAVFQIYAYSRTKGGYDETAPAGTLTFNAADQLYHSDTLSVTAENLGRFEIKEIRSGKPGYPSGRTMEIRWTKDQEGKTTAFTLQDTPNRLPVKKTDQNGKAVAGAEFTLIDAAVYNGTKQADSNTYSQTATTAADGLALFTEIPQGSYVLYESAAPDGYVLSTKTQAVTVNEENIISLDGREVQVSGSGAVTVGGIASGNAAVTVVNEANSLTVKKTDWQKNPVQGVTFELTRYSMTSTAAQETRTGTTGADGTYTWTALADGLWYLKETAVPNGITLCSERRKVEVWKGKVLVVDDGTDAQAHVTYTLWDTGSQKPLGHLYLKKVDKASGAVLTDAEFSVWEWDTEIQDADMTKPPVAVLKYNAADQRYETWAQSGGRDVWDSVIPVTDKNQGIFIVKETKAPAGHAASEEPIRVNLYENNTPTLTVQNEAQPKLIIVKYDGLTRSDNDFTNAVLLDGAKFKVWKDGESEQNAKVYTTGEGENGTHDAAHHGKITLPSLAHGTTYHVKEVKAPDGYVLDSTVYDVKVGDNGWIENQKEDYVLRMPNRQFFHLKLLTGGAGRTALYLGGGVLMALMAALAILRKKKQKEEEDDDPQAAEAETEDTEKQHKDDQDGMD